MANSLLRKDYYAPNNPPEQGDVYNPWWVRYLQFFAEDDIGVPPGCWWAFCPLSQQNWLFNRSPLFVRISKFGLVEYDKNRKFYLGLAALFTFFTFFITLWGCLALSTKRNLVQRTYWYAGTGHNSTDESDFTIYIGLRSLEQVNCKFVAGYDNYGSDCERHSIKWASPSCHEGLASTACDTCSDSATGMWVTAFMSCFSLILAWLGAQTRMRIVADIPAQKALGMWSDSWGVVTLGYALIHFHHHCLNPLQSSYNEDPNITTSFWSGPGFICYMVCCLSGIIRSGAHWLTPVPGQGSRDLSELLRLTCWPEISTESSHQQVHHTSKIGLLQDSNMCRTPNESFTDVVGKSKNDIESGNDTFSPIPSLSKDSGSYSELELLNVSNEVACPAK